MNPTHTRTEERAPVWVSKVYYKRRALQGDSEEIGAWLNRAGPIADVREQMFEVRNTGMRYTYRP
jgi:hypothetical protein